MTALGLTTIITRIIVRNIHDEILLLRRSPLESDYVGQWELPGGSLDYGEDPVDGIIRETTEETGIIVRSPQLSNITSKINKRGHQVICICYVTDVRSPTVTLSHEHDQYQWTLPQLVPLSQSTKRTAMIMRQYRQDLRETV